MIPISCTKALSSDVSCPLVASARRFYPLVTSANKFRFLIAVVALIAAACRGGDDTQAIFPLSINHVEAITQGHCLTIQTQALPVAAPLGRNDELSVTMNGTELQLYSTADCSGSAQPFVAQPYPQTLSLRMELPLPLATARVTTTLTWHSGDTTFESTLHVLDRAKNINIGNAFACTETESGHMQCWGDNSRAQLGAGNTFFGDYKNSPIAASLVGPALLTQSSSDVLIALGDYTGCGVNTSNSVSCWGSDFINVNTVRATPVAVPSLPTGVVDLTTDTNGACAALSNGRIYCWGQDTTNGAAEQVSGITNAIGVRKKGNHTCALLSTGGVVCWGENSSAQSAPDSELTTIDAPTAVTLSQPAIVIELGRQFSCALLDTGAVECWGIIGTAAPLLTATAVAFSAEVSQIAAGSNFICALLTNNKIECVGANTVGQLGNGTTAEASIASPASVELPVGTVQASVQTIAAGGFVDQNAVACAIIDGQSYCWGSNRVGQVGIGDIRQGPFTMPLAVQGLPSQITQVATNQSHVDAISCVLHTGRISCFGSNNDGQLGRGISPEMLARDSQPAQVQSITTATQVEVGFGFACARLQNGQVHCWGNNEGGQLGDGTTENRATPVAVAGLAGPATHISLGNRHVCAVVQSGVQCWGWDTKGQLGNGPNLDGTQSTAPVWVQGLEAGAGVTAVAAGEDYTCAIVQGGAQCWGRSHLGLLGNGVLGAADDFLSTPVNVLSLTPGSVQDPLVTIDAGMLSVCALSMQGRVHCWGGQNLLGLSDPSQYTGRPVTPFGLDSGVQMVASGGEHHCAVKNGQMLCWGSNTRGQLGLTHTREVSVPTQVTTIPPGTTILSVSTGGISFRGYTCAVTNSTTYCWGDNSDQQLGRDIPLFEHLPAAVAPWL